MKMSRHIHRRIEMRIYQAVTMMEQLRKNSQTETQKLNAGKSPEGESTK